MYNKFYANFDFRNVLSLKFMYILFFIDNAGGNPPPPPPPPPPLRIQPIPPRPRPQYRASGGTGRGARGGTRASGRGTVSGQNNQQIPALSAGKSNKNILLRL